MSMTKLYKPLEIHRRFCIVIERKYARAMRCRDARPQKYDIKIKHEIEICVKKNKSNENIKI